MGHLILKFIFSYVIIWAIVQNKNRKQKVVWEKLFAKCSGNDAMKIDGVE